MQLKEKTAVVTGGSDGIGRHICLKLAAEARAYAVDFMDTETLESSAEAIVADFGGVDVLINNAGVWHKAGPLDTISAEMLITTVQTNLTALMQLTRHMLPSLRTRGEAAVLNIASKSGVAAQAGQSVYSATKYGVRRLYRSAEGR